MAKISLIATLGLLLAFTATTQASILNDGNYFLQDASKEFDE
jgi:hypothetical protein